MTYQLDTSRYTGKPKHCCHGMDLALDEGYLEPTLTLWGKALPPNIQGPKLAKRGRKRKPDLIINYCPWCGKQLAEDDAQKVPPLVRDREDEWVDGEGRWEDFTR